MEELKLKNTSDHLANERTFLAWLRTSIGIMAFGFVVVKFSLFVKQISLLLGKSNFHSTERLFLNHGHSVSYCRNFDTGFIIFAL